MDGTATRLDLEALLRTLAADHPEAVAMFRADGKPVTFRELDARSAELAAQLPEGARRVALRIPNDVDGVAGVHAIWRRGASVVLIPPVVPAAELNRRIEQTQAQVVIRFDGGDDHVEALGADPVPLPDEAVVVFTSGTTGRPKGAVLAFESIAGSVISIAEAIGLPDGRRPADPPRSPTPIFMPLAHVGGFLATVTGMYQGKPLVVFDKFRAADVFDIVERFDLTMLRLAPTMLFDLAGWPEDRSLGKVRSVSVGSAPLSEAVRARFEDRYGAVVLQSYGLTELAGAIAFERYDDARAGRRKPDTVGRVAPGVRVRVVDEQGHPVAAGATGAIVATGPSRFVAYLDADGRTVPATDEWVRTGDIGRLDDDGFLTVLGRSDDMILCGGFNVYPRLVEAALCGCDGVLDAVVVGVPDERLGAIPAAAIVPAGPPIDPDDLDRHLRDALAPYEVPRRILAVAKLPRTEGGKPDRAAVVELLRVSAQELAPQSANMTGQGIEFPELGPRGG